MKGRSVDEGLTHVDLFCGPGGFATGFEWAGYETLLGLDHHAPSLSTYQHNHPDVDTILDDIRNVDADVIRDRIGRKPTVLTAGVPCEGFSMANRNRTRFTDERNFLFLEFLRISEALKPEVLVVENVANLARHDGGIFAREIEAGMAELGYLTTSSILDASEFGVPQRRRRIVFIGFRSKVSFFWPSVTHGQRSGLTPFVTVGEALLDDLPALESGESADHYSGPARSKYVKFLRGRRRKLLNHQAPNHPLETIERIRHTEPGKPMYESYKQRIRLDPNALSPTVVSGGIRPQFAYGHPTQARGLTIRERARLMSFPDSYEFLGGITQGRVQTGDAVPPVLAHAIASAIQGALDAGHTRGSSDLGRVHVGAVSTYMVGSEQLALDVTS